MKSNAILWHAFFSICFFFVLLDCYIGNSGLGVFLFICAIAAFYSTVSFSNNAIISRLKICWLGEISFKRYAHSSSVRSSPDTADILVMENEKHTCLASMTIIIGGLSKNNVLVILTNRNRKLYYYVSHHA